MEHTIDNLSAQLEQMQAVQNQNAFLQVVHLPLWQLCPLLNSFNWHLHVAPKLFIPLTLSCQVLASAYRQEGVSWSPD